MRAFAVAVLALAATIAPALPQGAVPGQLVTPLGYCQLTSLSSAVKLTSCNGGIPSGASMALMRVEGAAVRFRDDGGVPTSSVGMPLLTSDPPILYSGTLTALQFIQELSSGTIDVLFYR